MISPFIFALTEAISTWAYIPQVWKYLRDPQSRSSISLSSWVIWSIGCIVKLLYVWPATEVPLLKFYLMFDVVATGLVSVLGIHNRLYTFKVCKSQLSGAQRQKGLTMLFHVHTNQGVFKIDAPNPEVARKRVRDEYPGIFIDKVKLAAGERSKPREKS